MAITIAEPWLSFLREVDGALAKPVEVHCLGGFVLSVLWGLPRPTGDVDVVEVAPKASANGLLAIAGAGSDLSARYHLQFHLVTVAEYPENYASRLVDISPPEFRHLRLGAFEAHDLALAKLSRNSQRDREDVAFLVERGVLDKRILQKRFDEELQPYLLNPERETTTLELWIDEFFPVGNP